MQTIFLIFRLAPDAIVITKKKGILPSNSAFKKLFGYTIEELKT
jgi:PAS domain S-box-containing protein